MPGSRQISFKPSIRGSRFRRLRHDNLGRKLPRMIVAVSDGRQSLSHGGHVERYLALIVEGFYCCRWAVSRKVLHTGAFQMLIFPRVR